jgi:hypothetical protein
MRLFFTIALTATVLATSLPAAAQSTSSTTSRINALRASLTALLPRVTPSPEALLAGATTTIPAGLIAPAPAGGCVYSASSGSTGGSGSSVSVYGTAGGGVCTATIVTNP